MYCDVGKTVTLRCKYTTSSYQPYLFWYRQYANQMQYILYRGAGSVASMAHDGNFKSGKFKSETSESITSLTIYDMTVSDSAVYFCALRDGAQCDTYIVDPSINLLLTTTLPPADGRILYSSINIKHPPPYHPSTSRWQNPTHSKRFTFIPLHMALEKNSCLQQCLVCF
ncbi:unnamed protein product [Staurois parvus]|uniref:Ig-like domain-containing protein n=1 Tax=Staurois parvus TaxID=386267 RepID=A0ABN9HBD3_9NEOB|nr:unnamed protein product [Staurois parvus]